MNLKEIREELLRAVALVEDFGVNRLEIDRDAALNKMRQAYEALRFMKAEDITAYCLSKHKAYEAYPFGFVKKSV